METIMKHFESIGIDVSVKRVTNSYIKITSGRDHERFCQLCRYYFNDNVRASATDDDAVVVNIHDFNPDGHEQKNEEMAKIFRQ
jgi:hypothetical protein